MPFISIEHKTMFIRLLIIMTMSAFITKIECSHFFGGSISAKFVADTSPTTLLMQYQIRMGWRRDFFSILCTNAVINAATIYLGSTSYLITCTNNCFTSNIGVVNAYCIAYNLNDNWAYGEIIYNVTVYKNRKYVEGSFANGAWIPLNNPASSGGNWEVRTRIDTNYRTDINGYNSCPLTIMPPVIKLRLGIRQDFSIPYTDQDNDFVFCRQALAAKSECADVCSPISAVKWNNTACRMYFDGSLASLNPANGWYAITLQIEDYQTFTSASPMCSVPLQFMIQVQKSTSTCMTPPIWVGDWPEGSCIAANMNQQINLRMVAQVGCTSNSIYSIQILGPSITYGSNIIAVSGTTDQWSANLTWTPKLNQYGPNLVCGLATDSSYLISNLDCYTILAGITIPYIIRGTGYPSGTLTLAQQAGVGGFITWSIKFNINPILRPVKRTYVRLFYANGTQVFKMDCSIFPSVTYVNDTMFIVTGNNFAAGNYYWTFGYGVGTGPEFCHPETDTVTDPTFWTFTWVGPTTTILSTQTFPPGGTVGTSGASPTTAPILPLGVTTLSTTTTASTTANTGVTTASTTVVTTTTITATTATSTAIAVSSSLLSTTTILTTTGSLNGLNSTNQCKTLLPFPTSTNCTIQSMSLIFTTFLMTGLVGHVSSLTGILTYMTKKRMLFFE